MREAILELVTSDNTDSKEKKTAVEVNRVSDNNINCIRRINIQHICRFLLHSFMVILFCANRDINQINHFFVPLNTIFQYIRHNGLIALEITENCLENRDTTFTLLLSLITKG